MSRKLETPRPVKIPTVWETLSPMPFELDEEDRLLELSKDEIQEIAADVLDVADDEVEAIKLDAEEPLTDTATDTTLTFRSKGTGRGDLHWILLRSQRNVYQSPHPQESVRYSVRRLLARSLNASLTFCIRKTFPLQVTCCVHVERRPNAVLQPA